MSDDFEKGEIIFCFPSPLWVSLALYTHTHRKNDREASVDFGGSWREGLWQVIVFKHVPL